MVCLRGESLTTHRNQMKVLTASLGLTSILMVGCTLRSPDITVPITNDCQGQQLNAQQIYSRSKNSVAKIETGDGSGSAFIVSHQDGKTLLMTNSHVLETRDHVNVKFHNGRVLRGKRISDAGGADWEKVEDSLQDIALLQVDEVVGKPIVIANLDPQVGEDVIVIGSPMGVDSSLTKGVVSSMHMDSKIVQVDAPINPGNSGGPIIN